MRKENVVYMTSRYFVNKIQATGKPSPMKANEKVPINIGTFDKKYS